MVLALCGFSHSLRLCIKVFPLTMFQSVDLGKQLCVLNLYLWSRCKWLLDILSLFSKFKLVCLALLVTEKIDDSTLSCY